MPDFGPSDRTARRGTRDRSASAGRNPGDSKKRTLYHSVSHDHTTLFRRYAGSVDVGLLEDPKEARLRVEVLDAVFEYWGLYEILPLHTKYYQQLAPGPRALYEWLSYRLYAAALEGRATATIGYADFCRYGSQPRQNAVAEVQAQMEALHGPHFQSGYLAEVTYDAALDIDGLPDWILTYRAGERARKEFRQFRKRKIGAISPPPDFYALQRLNPAGEVASGSGTNKAPLE